MSNVFILLINASINIYTIYNLYITNCTTVFINITGFKFASLDIFVV